MMFGDEDRTALRGRGALLAIAVLLLAADAGAHNLGESYLYLQVYRDRVEGRFEASLEDLDRGLRLAGSGGLTRDNLDQHVPALQDYYRRHVTIAERGGPLPIRFSDHAFLDVRGGYVQLPFTLDGLDRIPERLTFDYSVLLEELPGHRGFVLIEHNWATGTFANESGISLVFSPGSTRQELELASSGRLRGFLAVVQLGTDHIWAGKDHVMFLVALLLPAVLRRQDGRWQMIERFAPALVNVLKIVTAFTVAHSVTLSLAALGLVRLPERLVESAIAVSIAVAAADILFPVFHGRVWLIVFAFGLFHGFGFAGALAEMGVLRENLALALFGFNLGVEIGQIVIVAAVFPVLYLLRRLALYRRVAVQAAAVAMILVACGWLYERVLDVDLPLTDTAVALARKVVS